VLLKSALNAKRAAAATTVKVALPVKLPDATVSVAVTFEEPVATAMAIPFVPPIVAVVVVAEVHARVAGADSGCVVPSLYISNAVNGTVEPTETLGAVGVVEPTS
jgi:hypothetical protein